MHVGVGFQGRTQKRVVGSNPPPHCRITKNKVFSLTNSSIGLNSFYRAMLCIRGTSRGPVSVPVCLSVSVCICLFVTSRSSTKTAKHRITQTTPHDSAGNLVFWCQKSTRNSTGVTPYEGTECRWGGQIRRVLTNNRVWATFSFLQYAIGRRKLPYLKPSRFVHPFR